MSDDLRQQILEIFGYEVAEVSPSRLAATLAVSDGRVHAIDVLIYSVSGARWWGGDDAAHIGRVY